MIENYKNYDDEVLLSLIIDGPSGWRELLAELLQRHRQPLLARCYRYLRNQQDAEDAAQETELRVYRAIRGFRRESGFRTWLFAIADRQCHDLSRKRARQLLGDHMRELIGIHEASLRRNEELSESAARENDRETVNNALAGVPRREREILMLRFHGDLALREVAECLGLGLSATKMRLYRALESFGARIEAGR